MVRWRAAWGLLALAVVVLAVVVLAPACARAQRGGRPDSVQKYLAKPQNPILNIDNQSAKTWTYTRLSDLLGMNRVVVRVTDPRTERTNLYEGIPLSQLVPELARYQIDIYREYWAFRDKLAVSSADLDHRADQIVADTVDGKRLGPDHPFSLIAKNRRGELVVVRELAYIRLADAR